MSDAGAPFWVHCPEPAVGRTGGAVGGCFESECVVLRSLPRVKFSELPDVVEHEVECEARVFSSEDLKREARKLDT
eukprot:8011336-Alexandrium_andersonii.AAC.1